MAQPRTHHHQQTLSAVTHFTTPSLATPPPSFPSVSVRCRVAAYGHLPSGIQSLFVGDGSLPSMAAGFPHPAGMTAEESGMAEVGMLAEEMGMAATNGRVLAGAGGAYYPPLTTPSPTTPSPAAPSPTTPSPATSPPSFPSVSVRCRVAAYGHLPSGIQKARKVRIRTTRATQCLFVGDGSLPSMATGFPRPAGMTAEESGMAEVGMLAEEMEMAAANGRALADGGGGEPVKVYV